MKVVDLALYRNKKLVEALEKKIGLLALSPGSPAVREMKICFSQWIKMSGI